MTPEEAATARRPLFACDAGGHLMEAVEIARTLFPNAAPVFYTADTAMSRSLLSGQDVEWAPRRVVPSRADLAAREIATALRVLRRHRPDLILSPGSAYALPWMVAARLTRRRAVFIESAARLRSQSRVGALVNRVPGVHRATQAPLAIDGWTQWPSVLTTALDSTPHVRRPPGSPPSIVVTVGTFEFPFTRLFDRLTAVLPQDWDVLWQHGTAAAPPWGDARPEMPYAELAEACGAADLVIGHAGVGTVLTATRAGARLVVVPRSPEHGEIVDDHQRELVDHLRHHHGIVTLGDVSDLTSDVIIRALADEPTR